MTERRISIFVSYAREDARLLRPLLDRLDQLADELPVAVRWDPHLEPGVDRERRPSDAVMTADIHLLMVSPAYFESPARRDAEMPAALDGRRDGATVIPIIVRAADLRKTPLASLMHLPRDGRPIESRRDKDAVFDEIVESVRNEVRRRVADAPPEPVPPPPPPGPAEPIEREELPSISGSTRAAVRELSGPVAAAEIVDRLRRLHPEYGAGLARGLSLLPAGTRRTVRDWLERVRALYRTDSVPTLHGRYVIRGLALLEPELTKMLLKDGFLSAIEGELDPPLDSSLSPHGRRLWEPQTPPALADRPARTDRLHRTSFADGLADMIEEERTASTAKTGRPESFLVHLHGPWGSGKTSLLGFLAERLRDSRSHWIVVQFNAWQHERLGAPWWGLMTAVHREGLRAPFAGGYERGWRDPRRWRDLVRSLRLLWFDLAWRIRLGWMAYLVLPVVLGLLYVAWREGFFDTAAGEQGWLTEAGNIAKPVGAIIGLIAALLGAVRGLGRSLSVGSARGAETFIKTSRDPMRTLRRRYERLVGTIGRPVAVFIDDMDRCQSGYVVEVLQGVQTLLIEAPVTYVVAADRRWLYDSYAKVYKDFRSVAREPGRPLGHLFLEKTFQLSATLPQLAPDVRDEYWGWLIDPQEDGAAIADAVASVRRRTQTAGLDQVAAGAVAESGAEAQAEREALAVRLSAPEVQEEIKNRLLPFSRLLEANPRAMKRLINAYRIELRRLLAEGRHMGRAAVTPEQIALWTIVSLRWPLLADQLTVHPDLLSGAPDDVLRPDLRQLWASQEVQAVVHGDGVPAHLTTHAVRAVTGLAPAHELAPASTQGNGAGAVA